MLTIISGRSGSGKSALLQQKLTEAAKTQNCILILPAQSTYDAERQLMSAMGGGLLGVEVMTLERLCGRVLEQTMGQRTYLSAEGKRMVMRKLLIENKDMLSLYGKVSAHSGTAQKLCEIIDSFKQAQAGPEVIESLSQGAADPILKKKLADIAVAYRALDQFMGQDYMDSALSAQLAAQRLTQAEFLKHTAIFADCLKAIQLNRQRYALLEGLMAFCDVTITLCYDGGDRADSALFTDERRAADRLVAMAKGLGQRAQLICLEPGQRRGPPAVRAIERHLFAYDLPELDPGGLALVTAGSREDEGEKCVSQICALLRRGVKAQDIAVACGRLEIYAPVLRRAMEKCGLPYFMDQSRPLASHPVVELILASLKAAKNGLRREDVLRAAKSGFSPVDDEGGEYLQSYANAYGVRFGAFKKPFVKGEGTELLARAEEARALVIEPILALAQGLKGKKGARECCMALFDYLQAIGLRQKLERHCELLTDRGELDAAREYAQVWNAVMSLMDQIALLGDSRAADFGALLEEGFAAHSIGVIPPAPDQLLVGDVRRLCDRNIDYLFLLGCTEGSVPREDTEEGIIGQKDVEYLQSRGVEAFLTDLAGARHERRIVYALLSRPRLGLWVSWPKIDSGGAELSPSPLFARLERLFPAAKKTPEPELNSREQAFSQVATQLRRMADTGREPQGLRESYALLWRQGWEKELLQLRRGLEGRSDFSPEAARGLYNRGFVSAVSRVETYNACPFKHLARYGLGLQEPREYSESAADRGDYYHAAFERLVNRVNELGLDWGAIEGDLLESLMADILDGIELEHNRGVLTEEDNAVERDFLRGRAVDCARALAHQLAAGDFRPVMCEAKVGRELEAIEIDLGGGQTARLQGVIDRVDVCADKGLARIIDYKTGDEKFSYTQLYNGIKLQLPLYLSATQELGQPSGMFYMRVANPALDEEEPDKSPYRLRGVLLLEEEVIRANDRDICGSSDILPIALGPKGYGDGGKGYLLSREKLRRVMDFAKAKAGEAIAAIYRGDARCAPLSSGSVSGYDACRWCAYGPLCRFEPKRGDQGRRVIKKTPKEFFEDE